MKATLEFNLPEENEEHKDAINGSLWKSVVWDIDQHLRSKIKYADLPDDQYKIYEDLREQLWQFVNENELTLN